MQQGFAWHRGELPSPSPCPLAEDMAEQGYQFAAPAGQAPAVVEQALDPLQEVQRMRVRI